MKEKYKNNDYPFQEGDRVCHIKEQGLQGVVTKIDRNLPHPTTCNVKWDGDDFIDIQWTNKLNKV